MNRTLSTRFVALFVAMLFLLNGAESAFGMHECPHHDLVVESGSAQATHGSTHDMAGMDGHSSPHSDHSAPCTCQGACQMGSAAALPEIAVVAPSATILIVEVPSLGAEVLRARHHVPFFLPYSQAPPRVG